MLKIPVSVELSRFFKLKSSLNATAGNMVFVVNLAKFVDICLQVEAGKIFELSAANLPHTNTKPYTIFKKCWQARSRCLRRHWKGHTCFYQMRKFRRKPSKRFFKLGLSNPCSSACNKPRILKSVGFTEWIPKYFKASSWAWTGRLLKCL